MSINVKSWAPDQRFYDLDGDPIKDFDVIFHGRINNDGLSVVPCDPKGPSAWFRVFCLSVTFDRWVATDGMATYIVELKPKP